MRATALGVGTARSLVIMTDTADHPTRVVDLDLPVLGPEMLAAEALNVMQTRKVNALLVVDADGVVVGALNLHDLTVTQQLVRGAEADQPRQVQEHDPVAACAHHLRRLGVALGGGHRHALGEAVDLLQRRGQRRRVA